MTDEPANRPDPLIVAATVIGFALIALGCFVMLWDGRGDQSQLSIILAGIATWAAQSQNSRATTRDVLKVQAAGGTT